MYLKDGVECKDQGLKKMYLRYIWFILDQREREYKKAQKEWCIPENKEV